MQSKGERFRVELAGGSAAGWRFPGPPQGPRLIFAHANGFCAAAYAPLFERLSGDAEIIAPDLRGHGRSTLTADPARHRSWDVHGEDLAAFAARMRSEAPDRMLLAAGHSMGAVCLMLARRKGAPLQSIHAFDPVLLPDWVSWATAGPLHGLFAANNPMSRAARNRRARFESRKAARIRYREKPAFARWDAAALSGYLEDGLTQDGGGVTLSCTPAWEAANYAAQGHDAWGALRASGAVTSILKAARRSTVAAPARARRLAKRLDELAGSGHLFPMEDPQAAAAWLRARIMEDKAS